MANNSNNKTSSPIVDKEELGIILNPLLLFQKAMISRSRKELSNHFISNEISTLIISMYFGARISLRKHMLGRLLLAMSPGQPPSTELIEAIRKASLKFEGGADNVLKGQEMIIEAVLKELGHDPGEPLPDNGETRQAE